MERTRMKTKRFSCCWFFNSFLIRLYRVYKLRGGHAAYTDGTYFVRNKFLEFMLPKLPETHLNNNIKLLIAVRASDIYFVLPFYSRWSELYSFLPVQQDQFFSGSLKNLSGALHFFYLSFFYIRKPLSIWACISGKIFANWDQRNLRCITTLTSHAAAFMSSKSRKNS